MTDRRVIEDAERHASARVAEADVAHAGEPMPREPHEGDYWRGQRDALRWVLGDEPDGVCQRCGATRPTVQVWYNGRRGNAQWCVPCASTYEAV